jgi:hypothetical protein
MPTIPVVVPIETTIGKNWPFSLTQKVRPAAWYSVADSISVPVLTGSSIYGFKTAISFKSYGFPVPFVAGESRHSEWLSSQQMAIYTCSIVALVSQNVDYDN